MGEKDGAESVIVNRRLVRILESNSLRRKENSREALFAVRRDERFPNRESPERAFRGGEAIAKRITVRMIFQMWFELHSDRMRKLLAGRLSEDAPRFLEG